MAIVPMNSRLPGPTEKPAIPAYEILADGDPGIVQDNDDGTLMIPTEDGGVIIDFNPNRSETNEGGKDHNANLAEFLDGGTLGMIGNELFTGISADEQSRLEWLNMRAQGIRLLGISISDPKSGVAASASGVEGQSTVQHPMLLEATLRFQANARGELLPSQGPVKVTSSGLMDSTALDSKAMKLENDLNYFLLNIATEYVPDTDRMLFYTGFGGCGFKKVYNCPIRRRPVSESVDAADLIVSDATTDMKNSARITHKIRMKPSTLRRMMIVGAYRELDIGTPTWNTANPVKEEVAQQQGVQAQPQNPLDQEFTLYETLCELDLPGYEHKDKAGKATGLRVPYRVVMDSVTQAIYEIRRNWKEDDELCLPKNAFVKFPFVPGLGFYDLGLVHILGNTTNAITAAWREMLDAGMFANFPGFLYARPMGRQYTNEFRVPPGGGTPIETNGKPISETVMPLPYKDISPAFAGFVEQIAQTGSRVGGTAEIQVSEGKQEAPVGTTLALIEQATKVIDAVHKRLHAAQAEEFAMLKECFREDPESFVRALNGKGGTAWDQESFIAALNDASLVPQADPNTPSHMHRLMKVMAIKQMAGATPEIYDMKVVDSRCFEMIGVNDFKAFFKPPSEPQPDPKTMVDLLKTKNDREMSTEDNQTKLATDQTKAAIAERASNDKQADREAELEKERMRQETAQVNAAKQHDLAERAQSFGERQHADSRADAGDDRMLDLKKHADEFGARKQEHEDGLLTGAADMALSAFQNEASNKIKADGQKAKAKKSDKSD